MARYRFPTDSGGPAHRPRGGEARPNSGKSLLSRLQAGGLDQRARENVERLCRRCGLEAAAIARTPLQHHMQKRIHPSVEDGGSGSRPVGTMGAPGGRPSGPRGHGRTSIPGVGKCGVGPEAGRPSVRSGRSPELGAGIVGGPIDCAIDCRAYTRAPPDEGRANSTHPLPCEPSGLLFQVKTEY